MFKMLKKLYETGDFDSCGKIIVAPKLNICALSCYHCNKLFLQMCAFMRHLRWEHAGIFRPRPFVKSPWQQSTQLQNVYTVEELLGIDNVREEQESTQLSSQDGLSFEIENLTETQKASQQENELISLNMVEESTTDVELQLQIEELLKNINGQRNNPKENDEGIEKMEICNSAADEVDKVTTSSKKFIVHIEVGDVDDTEDGFEKMEPIEIELNVDDMKCCSATDILPQAVLEDSLSSMATDVIEVEEPLEPYFIVDMNNELHAVDYSCRQENVQITNSVENCEVAALSSIENISKNNGPAGKVVDVKLPQVSMLKELLTKSHSNKIEYENHKTDNVNNTQYNLDKLSFVSNIQQKEVKNQVPIAVVQANNFSEKCNNDGRKTNEVEKLLLPLRKRILSSIIAPIDTKKCKLDKEQQLNENKSSPIFLNFTNESEQNAVTTLTENGLEVVQGGVTILSVNLTDAKQDELKAGYLSAQVPQTANDTDVAYMANDTPKQLKILIKIGQENSTVDGRLPEMMNEYNENNKTNVGDANMQQPLLYNRATGAEQEEKVNAYQLDFDLLCKVGLNSILDPGIEEKLPLQQKQEIYDKALKFAAIFVNFKHIWEVKEVVKCNKQLEEEFTELTKQTNVTFNEKLTIRQIKRIINLVSLWHKRCKQYVTRKILIPERNWYYMQIFSFLPKSFRRIFYCEECIKYFHSQIKYEKHRFLHSGSFCGFYCQYCHTVLAKWNFLRIHEQKCRHYNCVVCGLKCLKADGNKNYELCNHCNESCITTT